MTGPNGTVVQGTLNSTASTTFRIEFFSNTAADPSGYGEGQDYLGYISATTDSQGNATFQTTLSSVPAGQFISATATDPGNNTSEFCKDLVVSSSTATASFLERDTTTEGNWIGAYGAQGYDIEGFSHSLPSFATVNLTGASTYTWASTTTDPRGLLNPPSGPGRSAQTWYSPGSFKVDLNLTDGQAHDLELYLLDWDSTARAETVQVTDAASGTVLVTQSVSSFHGGVYLDYRISGHVAITITRTAGANAVLSGLFLDPAPPTTSATFLKQDAATQGTWIGTYGTQGYDVIGEPASLPSYATVTPSGQSTYTWAASTTDVRALQVPGGGSRIAATWYSASSFKVDLNLTDGQKHDLELYFLDWDTTTRAESVQISDATTGAVLSTQAISSFHNGIYLDYAVSGNILITITKTAGANAVLSGLFLDPKSSSTAAIADPTMARLAGRFIVQPSAARAGLAHGHPRGGGWRSSGSGLGCIVPGDRGPVASSRGEGRFSRYARGRGLDPGHHDRPSSGWKCPASCDPTPRSPTRRYGRAGGGTATQPGPAFRRSRRVVAVVHPVRRSASTRGQSRVADRQCAEVRPDQFGAFRHGPGRPDAAHPSKKIGQGARNRKQQISTARKKESGAASGTSPGSIRLRNRFCRLWAFPPGRSGRFPTQTPRRSVLARLTHTAPRFKPSLRDEIPSGRVSVADPALGMWTRRTGFTRRVAMKGFRVRVSSSPSRAYQTL